MKVLVTGGAGFIGSHLSRELWRQGHQVNVIDSLVGGRKETIADLLGQERFEFHQADIRDGQTIAPLFAGIDWVFHLAGLADIVPSIEQPRAYYETNVSGTFNVLEAARAAGIKRFVYAASSSCYGIPVQFPTPETAAIQPQYPYALTKYLGEELVMHWAQLYDLPAVSLRLFNVYGPHARTTGAYGAVFGVFLAQKINGKPFTVVGDGTQTRDFTYVTDVADAFIAAAESELRGEIMNVGSGGTYSVNQLVGLLGGAIEYIPKRPGEPDCTFADTNKIKTKLGWQPQVSFEQGVANMLAHIDYWQNAPLWTSASIADATADWFKYLDK
ncbi:MULTISPECIES: SDR family oxidoreductase [Methylomonas]|uniref:NAD-dependent dehydratase n=2 Tax=Methylomonas TaxID=416 RepID=A0A126T6N0_9GAMM|nr:MULTISPECIES: SDR family oxidoreductase [Methylomonas]AMK77745.1 NAD-dependent dehydratase [Methylomonas denitrificans]OAI08671.1 NAD-dependent dehydratase [Methylomonas methanica]TCV86918.1 UDP-glucose 4-epimerase [Methylomonas methanica]